MKRMVFSLVAAVAMSLLVQAQGAAARDFDLAFVPGKSYAVVSNSVIRGDRDHYYFGARPGQFISVAITSLEDNAVVEVWYRQAGEWLPADVPPDTRTLYGALPPPPGGQYRITVGGTRGNATYDLFVGISVVGQ